MRVFEILRNCAFVDIDTDLWLASREFVFGKTGVALEYPVYPFGVYLFISVDGSGALRE